MKTIRMLFIFTVISLISLNIMAAKGNTDKTEIRQTGSFNGIKVSTGIDLYITMGTTEEVKIVADDEIIDDLITEVKDGTLKIYMKQSNNWFNWNSGTQTRIAYVTVKELVSIDASSGSDVKSENTLKGEDLKVKASSGSDVVIDVFYKNVWVDTSSGSDAKLSGNVKTLNAEASSGSDIDAKNLESKICKARVSSGSDAIVNVTDELYANASSGADIRYYGNPQVKDIDESSGGDVTQK
jgi:hypothetical protein